MKRSKDQIEKLLKFGNAVIDICGLDLQLFMAAICSSIDTYVIEHDYDRESFFEALADMFYFDDGEPENDK